MKLRKKAQPAAPLGVTIHEAAVVAGVGRDLVHQAIRSGELRVATIGRRRVVRVAELDRWLASKEAV